MTKPHLRRWHFDLALLAGIVMIAISYWYIGPNPRWQSRIPTDPSIPMHVSALGFSQDEQCYYTLKDDYLISSRKPQPMIQRWNVKTGELQAEYALQVPDGDVAQWKLPPPGIQDYGVYPLMLPQSNFVQIFQSVDRQSSLDSYRLFDITTGECMTKNPPTVTHLGMHYLIQNPQDGHHWGCFVRNYKPDEPVQLIDLSEGKIMTSIKPPVGASWQRSGVLENQKKLIITWHSAPNESGKISSMLTVHQLGTWECLQQIPLPVHPYGIHEIIESGLDQFEIKYFLREQENIIEETTHFRFNTQSREYESALPMTTVQFRDNGHFWDLNHSVRVHRDTFRNTSKPHEFILTIRNFLERYGVFLWRLNTEEQISIYNAKTGSLMRRLSNLPELGNGLSISGHYLACLKPDEGSYTLSLYEIPHYVWQPTLRGIMYLSWVLILLWPFRYFIHVGKPKNAPMAVGNHD